MNYKIFKVKFNNETEEYPIPIGWEINQVIFATDEHTVLVLRQIEPPRINNDHVYRGDLAQPTTAVALRGY